VVAAYLHPTLHDLADLHEVTSLVQRVRADLDVLAMPGVPGPLAQAVRHSLDLGLGKLDALLVQPLGLRGRSAVLSCSGELLFLPWGLTPGRAGVPTVVTPSAAGWLQGRRRTRPSHPRVLAVAGPDLRLSTAEATAVAATWEGGEALVGASATAAETRTGLVRSDLMHVAAHGLHRPESPLFSSVRMADGPLFAYEIDPAEGLAGCVFLSACDAGLATTRPGDENLGMANVLLQLGVGTVVAGVARINDEVSAGVMGKVHEDLVRGIDVSSSLATRLHETLSRHTPAALLCLGSSW
jgi:CHAT domain-containing protein